MAPGVLTVRLALFEAVSLNDKRRVIKSNQDTVRNRYSVSVAEVGVRDER
jgi:uncharacterized protein YlxP (DUF503 family)